MIMRAELDPRGSAPVEGRSSPRSARGAAVVTWIYAAGFGIPAIPVGVYLLNKGRLPTFINLFEMYGGPWFLRVEPRTFVGLLGAFSVACALNAWSGWLLWRGRKAGAVLNLSLLSIEAIFWLGFALPFPWLCGAARVVLVVASWRSLGGLSSAGSVSRIPQFGRSGRL
jgi:hypothetical protein